MPAWFFIDHLFTQEVAGQRGSEIAIVSTGRPRNGWPLFSIDKAGKDATPQSDLPDVPVHVVQRGHNRAACFFCDDDFVKYKIALARAARSYAVAINAHVLMTSHVHLLVTPADETDISSMMSLLGTTCVGYVNRVHGRRGTLWEGRHKASLVSSDNYFLRCLRYIELNPVRAAMVSSPHDSPWSSYRHHVGLCNDPLIIFTFDGSPTEHLSPRAATLRDLG